MLFRSKNRHTYDAGYGISLDIAGVIVYAAGIAFAGATIGIVMGVAHIVAEAVAKLP